MARTKPPSFDFFVDDFIAGTYHIPAEAVGVYVRLLCYQWNNGSIPDDHEQLARIGGVDTQVIRTYIRIIYEKFQKLENGSLQNERMERERLHRLSVIEKSKAAINSRWSKQKAGKASVSVAQTTSPAHTGVYTDVVPPTPNTQHPTPNKDISQPCENSSTGEPDVIVPTELADVWHKWTSYYLAKTGNAMPGYQQEVILMDLASRGWDKARADVLFSIRIGASAVRDSDNDFDKNNRRGSTPSKPEPKKEKELPMLTELPPHIVEIYKRQAEERRKRNEEFERTGHYRTV